MVAGTPNSPSTVIPQPKFQLGEEIWLAGTPSYLINGQRPPSLANKEAWLAYLNTWAVTEAPVKIIGMQLSEDGSKIYYYFPGKGNDDGTNMFRNREDAVNFATLKNNP